MQLPTPETSRGSSFFPAGVQSHEFKTTTEIRLEKGTGCAMNVLRDT